VAPRSPHSGELVNARPVYCLDLTFGGATLARSIALTSLSAALNTISPPSQSILSEMGG